jgi:catechol 2,3-dioxygenase-like lactoylglutathione lyase family enzyme
MMSMHGSIVAAVAALAIFAPTLTGSQSSASRPRITGINHVAFRVSDMGATRRFYAEMLGLTPLRHVNGRSGQVTPQSGNARSVFAIGPRQHVVLEPRLPSSRRLRPERPFDGAQGRPELAEGRGAQPSADDDERLLHVAFESPDLAALTAHLQSRGVDVQTTDECTNGAIRVIDPDDHTIEFVQAQWPPPRSQAQTSGALSSRLLHAGLIIRDEQSAHRFYRDTLGFSEIWRGGRKEGVTQWVNMRVPDGTEYLEYMLVTAPPDRRQRGVLHHIAMLVPDIQAAWEEVARRTPEVERPSLSRPQVGVNGRWQLNLFDPDGTRAELMEPFRVR